MEIQGAAIATMLSNTAASIYFILFICKKGDGLSIRLSPKCYTLTQHIPADVLSVGLPSFMISMMATVSNTALNRIIAAYSTEAVAGMGIAKKSICLRLQWVKACPKAHSRSSDITFLPGIAQG